jgi:predicted TIM-barrel fold metal-dependent hydrolase
MHAIDLRLRPPLPSWRDKPQFKEGSGYYPTRIGFPRPPSSQQQSIALLKQEMDEAGIKWGVIMGRQSAPPLGFIPNDEIVATIEASPDRFVGFAGIDLKDVETGVREIHRTAKLPGIKGMSIEPAAAATPMWNDDRQRLYPLYEACQSLGLPMSVTISGFIPASVGNDLTWASPTSMYRAAKDFPKLQLVISHGAWPAVMPVIEVAFLCENVILSPDLYMNHVDTPGAQEYIKAARLFMPDRLLWGTAYPSRPLKESLEAFLKWDLDPVLRDKILFGNAARLMNLS